MADAPPAVAGVPAGATAAPTAGPAGDPPVVSAPAFTPGDTWVFDRSSERGTTGYTESRVDLTIDRVDSDTMLVGAKPDGAPTAFEDHRLGLDWSQRRLVDGAQTLNGRPFAFPMKIGDTWTADHVDSTPRGRRTFLHFHGGYRVIGWETVTVPAGVFRALKIEENGMVEERITSPATASSAAVATPSGGATVATAERAHNDLVHLTTYGVMYYVPAIKYFVKSVEEQYDGDNVRIRRDTDVLVSFRPGP